MASGDDYRDELAAAHARIAALEGQLSLLTGKSQGVLDRKVADLEARQAIAKKGASPSNILKLTLFMTLLPLVVFTLPAVALAFSVPSATFWDLAVFPIFGAVVAVVLAAICRLVLPRTARQALAKVESELAEAVRLRELEREVGETRRLLARAVEAESAPARARIAEETGADDADTDDEADLRARSTR